MSIYFDFLFIFLSIFYSLCIIFSKNPIHSILYLILVFLNISCLFFKYSLEFLGIFLIIIYVGAISILFLFVIMMLKLKEQTKTNNKQTFIIILIFFFQLMLISPTIFITNSIENLNWLQYVDIFSNIIIFGNILYTYYFSYILIVGLILLLALISSIFLTLPKLKKKETLKIYKQLSRNSNIIFFKKILKY